MAIATAIALLLSAAFVAPQYRATVYRALAGDLALPVVGWYAMKAIEGRRVRKAKESVSTSDP